jgi:type IV fimbrial biogenesis protein FimT
MQSFRQLPSRQANSGFTLVELMVAVSIAGILVTIGLPSMRDLMANQRVKTAASDMHLSLLLARSEAIKRNANIDIVDTTAGWDVRVQSDSSVLRSQDLNTGVTINCDTDNDGTADTCPASITFTRTGRPTSYIEFRMFVSGNTNVITRCVSLRLSGIPQVSLDDDSDSANGC